MDLYRTLKIFTLCCIAFVISACFKENYLEEKTVGFSLVAIKPLHNSTEVEVNSKIYVTFNEEVDEKTLNSYTIQVLDGNNQNVDGRISFNSISKTLMFEPYMPLAHDDLLKVIISNKIRSKAGINLSDTSYVAFKTRKSPQQNIFSPSDGALDVSPRSRILLQFNDEVYINSVNENSIQLKESITGSFVEFDLEVDKVSLTATLYVSDDYNLSQGFKPETQYTYALTSEILNRSGNSLFDEDTSVTFTTSKKTPFTNTIASNREDIVASINLVTDGSLIVAGKTWGSLDSKDIIHYDGDGFIAALDPITGKVHDAVQFGSGANSNWSLKIIDSVNDMITIDNNIYVVGVTNGNLQDSDVSPGNNKMFLAKYTWNGVSIQASDNPVTVTSVNGDLKAYSMTKNADNDAIYIVGTTTGDISSELNKGKQDIFVAKYDVNLNQVWIKLYGTIEGDVAKDIAVDGSSIFVAGDSFGNFSRNNESFDNLNFFLLQLDESDGSEINVRFDTTSDVVNPDGAFARMATGIAAKDGKVYFVGTQRIKEKTNTFALIYGTDDSAPLYKKIENSTFGEDEKATGIYLSPEGDIYVAVTRYNVQQMGATTNIDILNDTGFSQFKSLQAGEFASVRSMVIDRVGSFFASGIINGNIDGMTPLGKGDVFIALP